MKSLLALMRKEYMEATRTGKIMIIILLFVLFGIMSPAVAKLTPWMMEMLSDSMSGEWVDCHKCSSGCIDFMDAIF